MTSDRIDRTVVIGDFPIGAIPPAEPVARERRVGLDVAAGIARSAVMVALASLAILVLLPAALAAQAASAF